MTYGIEDLGEYQFHSGETITFQTTIYSPVTITDLYPAPGTNRFCIETIGSLCGEYGIEDAQWNISVGQFINASESNPFTVSVTIHYESVLGEAHGSQQDTPTISTNWEHPHFEYYVPESPIPPVVVPPIPPEEPTPPTEQPPAPTPDQPTPPISQPAFPLTEPAPLLSPVLTAVAVPIGLSVLTLFLAGKK